MNVYFTIGHSTRSLAEFRACLDAQRVGLVADVRSIARSRTNPQFNRDTLPGALARDGIDYMHVAALGGRRGRAADVDPAVNAWWQVAAFHNYADHALSPAFAAGMDALRALGATRRVAVMCAEAVWWRCHRRIVADYLLAGGAEVVHIMGVDKVEPALLTPAAQLRADGSIVYPAGDLVDG